MDSFEFCIWLKGFFDLAEPTHIGATQLRQIRERLDQAVGIELKERFPLTTAPAIGHPPTATDHQ